MKKLLLGLMFLLAGSSQIVADCDWACKTYFISSLGTTPNAAAYHDCKVYCEANGGNQPPGGPSAADYAPYATPAGYVRPANLPLNTVDVINGPPNGYNWAGTTIISKQPDQGWCMTQEDCDVFTQGLHEQKCHIFSDYGVCY